MTYLTYYETHVERSTQFKGYLEIVYAYRVFIKLWMHAWLGKYREELKSEKRNTKVAGFKSFIYCHYFCLYYHLLFPLVNLKLYKNL